MKKKLLLLLCVPLILFGQTDTTDYSYNDFGMIVECIFGDCENGYGEEIAYYAEACGDYRYIGFFKNSEFHGEGLFISGYEAGSQSKYIGKWKDGKEDGKGKWEGPDGRIKEGFWKDGEFLECGKNPTPPLKHLHESNWSYKRNSLYKKYINDYNKWKACHNSYYTSVVESSPKSFIIILDKPNIASSDISEIYKKLKMIRDTGFNSGYLWSEIEDKFVLFVGPFELKDEAKQHNKALDGLRISNGEIIQLK